MVSCSSLPNPDLKVSEVSIIHKGPGGKAGKEYVFNVLAQSKDEINIEGFKCLSNNPMNNEYVCSGGIVNTKNEGDILNHPETGILIWKLDQSIMP